VPRFTALVLLLLAGTLACTLGIAQQPARRIRFPRGGDSTVVRGSVVRAEVGRYLLGARAGQRMQVQIRSTEGNAVFQLYPPQSRKALPGAAEGEDARRWSGRLPASGDYLLVVGSTRGNATFSLHVSIR
jgi:hypothetical protein